MACIDQLAAELNLAGRWGLWHSGLRGEAVELVPDLVERLQGERLLRCSQRDYPAR